MRHLAIPALALVCLALQPARASACSAPSQCPQRSTVLPEDGATDVPTNTEVHVDYWQRCSWSGTCASIDDIRLRIADTGEEIALVSSPHAGRLRPTSELAPSTRYELLDRDFGGGECLDTPGELIVVATFTTGTGPDLVPPSAPTALTALGCRYDRCDHGACCGPYEAFVSGVEWQHATDDRAHPLGYLVRDHVVYGERVFVYTVNVSTGGLYPGAGLQTGSGEYTITAIDLAGNESAPSNAATVSFDCRPPPRDAGVPDASTSDAGSPSDAATSPTDAAASPTDAATSPTDASTMRDASTPDAGPATRSASSCSVTRAPEPSWLVWLLVVAVIRARARARARARGRFAPT